MEIFTSLLTGGVSFLQVVGGLMTHPYDTYRRIINRGTLWELPYIAGLLAIYFSFAALVKTSTFRPYLLTKEFILLAGAAVVSFGLVVITLWFLGNFFGGKGSPGQLAIAWAYTLVPTTAWFFITSLLYVVLPPPRTESWKGIAFSLLYLVFATTLLWWKITLYYLTLRFGLRLDLGKIVLVSACAAPLFVLYSVAMYRFGIFKIPFL